MKPGEHKTVQARILKYGEANGWSFLPREEAEQRHGLKERVGHWAGKLDVDVVWLGVRPMRNKWDSCSSSGHLNFNADLLDLKIELWDFVIVHGLLHFLIPNHAKQWKSLMRAHLCEYEAYEAELKQIAHHKRFHS